MALPGNKYVTSDIRSVATAVLAVSKSEIIQHTDFKALSKRRFFCHSIRQYVFTDVIYIACIAPRLYTVSTTIRKREIMDKSKKFELFFNILIFVFFTTISLWGIARYFYWISITCFYVCLHHWQWKASCMPVPCS